MFVELLGLPASGKSTLARGCQRRLKAAGWSVGVSVQLDEIDGQRRGYMWKHPATRILNRFEDVLADYPEFMRLVDEIGVGSKVAKAMLRAETLRYVIQKANPEHFDIVISEEGMLHRAIYLINRYADDPFKTLEQICAAMPLVDGVAFLDISAEQSEQRARERLAVRSNQTVDTPLVQRRIRNAHGGLEDLDRRRQLAKHAVAYLSDRGCPILQVSTDSDASTAGDEAFAAFDRMLNARLEPQQS